MGRKKIKLEGEDISEILVADTDSESGAETCNDVVVVVVEEEEEDDDDEEPQAATSGGGLQIWEPPQGRSNKWCEKK